jgi:hypothetical protein
MHMRILLAALVANLIACAADEPPVGYPTGLGTPTDPLPSVGGYAVQSRVVVALGIADVDNAIAQLQAFSQHGGTTLLAQGASSPAGQALAALPTALRSKLDGWIDLELDKQKLGTVTARQAVGDIAMMAQTVVTAFVIESSLTISPTGAQHSLQDLNFRPASLDVVIPIGGLMADEIMQHPTAEVGMGGALAVGDQHFKLALGSHAWQALNLAVETNYGGDLSLVQHLNCDAIAQAVAARCVSGVCVGHASDLQALCQQGVTTLVDRLRDGLAPVVLDVHFADGTGHLVDADHNGVAEQIVGTWDAETNDGLGARATSIAFTAFD